MEQFVFLFFFNLTKITAAGLKNEKSTNSRLSCMFTSCLCTNTCLYIDMVYLVQVYVMQFSLSCIVIILLYAVVLLVETVA